MIRIAIVDDEPEVARYIAEKTKEKAEALKIPIALRLYHSGTEFLHSYTARMFDVVFLDIQMPEMSGDAVSAELIRKDADILLVYVTNLCNGEVYTMLKYMPIGFLRKPLFENEIGDMLVVLKKRIAAAQRSYCIQNGKQKFQIPIQNVLYIESKLNYLYFHIFRNNQVEVLKIRKKLDDVEKEIENFSFIRAHSSFLVNFKYIYAIESNAIKLVTDEMIPISKSHLAHVRERYLFFSREI